MAAAPTNVTKGCFPPLTTPVLDASSFARGEFRFTEPWLTYFACLAKADQATGELSLDDDGRPSSGGTGCAVTTIFQGEEVCLSPDPLLSNPISGQYELDLYNFLQQFPGSWDFGCFQGMDPRGFRIYTWPWVDIDPRPANPIPPDWLPAMSVVGTRSPYLGNFIIHKDPACPT